MVQIMINNLLWNYIYFTPNFGEEANLFKSSILNKSGNFIRNQDIYSEESDEKIRITKHWENTKYANIYFKGSGCPLGCIYCNQISLDMKDNVKTAGYIYPAIDGGISINTRLMVKDKIIKNVKIDYIFEELKNYPYYDKDIPIILQNFSDPGLNWKEAIDIGKRIILELNHNAAIVFITKMGILDSDVKEMLQLKAIGGKPICIVTYANLPKQIEPASVENRLKTIKSLNNVGIPTILSIRPVIKNINDSEESIKKVIDTAGRYADAIIVGGLYVYPSDTIDAFKNAGYELRDEDYNKDVYTIAMITPKNIINKVRSIAYDLKIKARVYDHTTCSIAYVTSVLYNSYTYDKFGHWLQNNKIVFDHCKEFCHEIQISNCLKISKRNPKEIIELAKQKLKEMGFEYDIIISKKRLNTLLIKNASLTVSEIYTLKRITGWQVDNLPNKDEVEYRTKEAMNENLKVNTNLFKFAISVYEEWWIFVNGIIDNSNNRLATQWIRNRNHCRIQVININDLSDNRIDNLAKTLIEIEKVELKYKNIIKILKNVRNKLTTNAVNL